jgi:hypothetical protein
MKHPKTLAFLACLAAAGAAPLAIAQGAAKPLASTTLDAGAVAEVTESARKDGTLTVRVRFSNPGAKPVKLRLVDAQGYVHTYISSGSTKYPLIRDTSGKDVATPRDGGGWLEPTIKPKASWGWWGKFPAPPAAQKTYTLYFKEGPPIEDVPIVDK